MVKASSTNGHDVDHKIYLPSSLAELFRKRWNAELNFRNIKTTMGMEQLRSQSPSMLLKELSIFLIAYNLIRLVMFEAAQKNQVLLQSISFKGTVDLLTSCTWIFRQRIPKKRLRLNLLLLIAADSLPRRPDRSEPRVLKRRLIPYQLLSTPRHQMFVIAHQGKYRKTAYLSAILVSPIFIIFRKARSAMRLMIFL